MLGYCTSECYVVLPFLLVLFKEFTILVIIIIIYFIYILARYIIYSQYSIEFSFQYKVCSYKMRVFIIYLVVPVVVVVVVVGGNGNGTT